MAARHHSHRQQEELFGIKSDDDQCAVTNATPVDPHEFGLTKAAYSVGEVLEQLSIGRTSLYAAVKRRELSPVKFGRKTLFYATDLAAFLTKLKKAQINIEPTARAP
jgi:excisionase family DNA binding protein